MNKFRNHIAFLLFGIFFFPIIFQSVHIVLHHSHGSECEHNHCFQSITNKDLHLNGANVFEKEKTCPICEYRFSINDLPKISLFKATTPVFAGTCNEVAAKQQYIQVLSFKTPRAPPVLVS